MSSQTPPVVFIIDDNPSNVKVLSETLKSFGYKTLVAMDGLSGIQKITKSLPDLILLDILMPEIDGFETCQRLKQSEVTRDIPIIFMTALASTEDKVKGLKLGAVDYITKPFQEEELIARLELHLQLRRLSQDLAEQNQQLQAEIAQREAAEAQIRILSKVSQQSPASIVITNVRGEIEYVNPKFERLTGYTFEEVIGKNPRILKSGETPSQEYAHIWKLLSNGLEWHGEFHNKKRNGELYWEQASISSIKDDNGKITHYVAIKEDITLRKQAELELIQQIERDRIVAELTINIRQSLDLSQILNTTVDELKRILNIDRVLAYQIFDDGTGKAVAEAVNENLDKVLDMVFPLEIFPRETYQIYIEGKVHHVDNCDNYEMAPCLNEYLHSLGVKAKLVAPVLKNENSLWGLLVAHHHTEHHWQDWEIEFFHQVSNQLAIAINQASLYTKLQYELQERKQMEVALQALNQDLETRVQQRTSALVYSEQRLEKIVANISDGILIMNSHGVIVFANPSAERMLGLDGGNLRDFKTNIPFKNNEELEVQILAEPHKMGIAEIQRVEIDWDGSKHFLASLRDITERKENENLLREVLKQVQDYKYALDQSAIVYITDSLGVITYANENFYRLTGYDRAEVIGSTPRLTNSQYHPPEFYNQMWSEIAIGRVWHGEIKNQRKDKNYYWIDITIIPFTNQKGKVDQYLAIQFDISDRKQIEEERQKLDLLVKNSSEFIAIADLEGNITYLNEAGKQMIGIDGLSLGNLHDYLKPATHSPENISSDALLQGAYEGECFINHLPTDTSIPTLCNIFLIKDRDGTPINIGAVSRDISKLKQAESEILNSLEKEKELSMLRSNFVSMASHELRTPLAIVSSSAGILQTYSDRLTDVKKSQHLQRIQTSIKHMTELIDDVLTLNRAEVGRVEFHPEILDIVSFCRNLNEEIQLSTNKHKLEFNSQEDSILAPIDTKLIRQILTNILTNAIKYTPQSGIIKFDLSVTTENVVFQITDSGIGMSPEDLAALFSSFHRGSNVGTIPGNGLGLAIVKKCVDLHKGQIFARSEIKTGSVFEVTIPLSISP